MIRYLDGNEKAGSRDLWEEAFPEDSRSFDDYYFVEKLKDNRILVLEETRLEETLLDESQLDEAQLEESYLEKTQEVAGVGIRNEWIASMIHLNPYEVRAAGEKWHIDYLVGVATRKGRRHRGYMRKLLGRMMEDMRSWGMPFCFLMPADAAIYRPFGFTYIYRQPFMKLKDGIELDEQEILLADVGGRTFPDLTELSIWMNEWLQSRYEVFAVRDEAYVRRLLKELASENGSFRLLYDGEVLVGMISEWGLEKREQRLLYCGDAYVEEVREPEPAIMARIITPENFVRAIRLEETYAGEELTIRLELVDPLIQENDGRWMWHLDKKSSWMERQTGTMRQEADVHGIPFPEAIQEIWGMTAEEIELSLTIEEFTLWLFGYGLPEAVQRLGLDKAVRALQGVFLDEIV